MPGIRWSDEEDKALHDPEIDSFDKWVEATGNSGGRTMDAWRQRRYRAGLTALVHSLSESNRNRSFGARVRNMSTPPDELLLEEIERLRAQVRDVKAERRRARESEAWADIVTAAVQESIPRLPFVDHSDLILPTPDPDQIEQELILVLSDIQIGSHVTSEETGGLAEYDFNVFMEQTERLEAAVAEVRLQQLSHVPI